MSSKKRTYYSELRTQQSQDTKIHIMDAAKQLFELKGFDQVTINEIAATAQVSAPSIYAIFKSKRGILFTIMDEALSNEKRNELIELVYQEKSPGRKLEIAAEIARQLYDAEKKQLSMLRGVSIINPQLKKLETEMEKRRYKRQQETVETIAKDDVFKKGISITQARDILWTLTGRDIYRMLVIERKWSSDEYQAWLSEILIMNLLK
ncbi:MAG: TetR/AcrR family transcriptional regulator [Proteobacteria bacterium]|nr:TetR/AcrR family transcriptional regulator [Pseudomonadota bacterium]